MWSALRALFFPLLFLGCIPDSDAPPVPTTAADLSRLDVSAGPLSPTFSGANTNYTVATGSTTTSTTITAVPVQADATLQINNQPAQSGQPFGPISLNVGQNPISIVVTPRGSDPKSYTVTVVRGANVNLSALAVSAGSLSPGFAPDTVNYAVSAPNSVAQTTITPTAAEAGSTITIDGTAVTSGQPFGPRPLNVGPNTFTILLRGTDQISTKTYTVVITRAASSNANLSGIQVVPGRLTPTFSPAVLTYSVTNVGLFTPTIAVAATLQDATATLTINGQAVGSGQPLAGIPIGIGVTPIPIVVRAQDTVTAQTYQLNVSRP